MAAGQLGPARETSKYSGSLCLKDLDLTNHTSAVLSCVSSVESLACSPCTETFSLADLFFVALSAQLANDGKQASNFLTISWNKG